MNNREMANILREVVQRNEASDISYRYTWECGQIETVIEALDPPEDPPFVGCPVLGHDCYETRCQTKCRMCAFSHAEMAADRERNA